MDKYKILIVDDEPDNLALLYRTLRGKYDIAKSTSPLAALEMMKLEHFNCILSDHKMPEMDGVEFLKRSCEITPDAMRLLVTAYTDAGILIDAINYAKIYRYIKKPYNPDELSLIVENALEYWQLKADNSVLVNDLKELFAGTITAIVEALDAKDSYTLGRSRRVTFYAVKMAKALHLSETTTGKIELAGLLHDIGMIGISDDILSKVEELTHDEYSEIKQHVHHSIKILDDIKQLRDVVEIIKYHHEFYDGNGYPFGKKGEDIPIGSRIIAVADAFDSMTTPKAYRNQVTPEEALNRIKSHSGKQFDPIVVETLEQILPEALIEIKDLERKLKENC
ncbi:MAG: HD domain-containing protein [Candidatus Gastranaerophilales bacterium]|nr:HD domain-containing protein [Candidatus Gastranaerophilales bacterium]